MVAFRAILSSVLASVLLASQVVNGAGLLERDASTSHRLQERQAIAAGVCATVDLAVGVPGVIAPINIARGVCICAQGGAITPSSVATLTSQVRANSGVLAPVINLLGITQTVTNLGNSLLPTIIGTTPPTCNYPANSIANQCGGCGYECAANYKNCGNQCIPTSTTCCPTAGTVACGTQCITQGSTCCPTAGTVACGTQCITQGTTCCLTAGTVACGTQCITQGSTCCPTAGTIACGTRCITQGTTCCPTAGTFACGTQCVADGTVCQSNIPRRRDFGRVNTASCPVGFEACRIPSSTKSVGPSFECISTASDLESCGGCVMPLPGRPLGQDCSAIPNVDSAVCQAGRCVVQSCMRGFTTNGTSCVEGESTGRKLSGYWAALQEASQIIL